MFSFRRVIATLAILSQTACTTVKINQHLAATDYVGNPQRILVINNLDSSFDETFPGSFAATMVPTLASCGVAALIYKPEPMQLDADAKFKVALDGFNADTWLGIRQTNRFSMNGEVRSGGYILTLHDIKQNRDIWKAQMFVGASTRWMADRTKLGPEFAMDVVRQMAADNVLKSCPPFPPKPT